MHPYMFYRATRAMQRLCGRPRPIHVWRVLLDRATRNCLSLTVCLSPSCVV